MCFGEGSDTSAEGDTKKDAKDDGADDEEHPYRLRAAVRVSRRYG